jgi:hypothetical protein
MSTEWKYANRLGYSEVYPYEIIRVVSDKCVEVREMATSRDPSWVPHITPGGFAGHCDNQHQQTWFYHSDPANPIVRIRLCKNGWWMYKGSKFRMAEEPRYFYDYNF